MPTATPGAKSAIDLRSDTVTLPTPAMRAAMAAAPVGDDQYGEDPTINLLQDQLATLLGKQAALWLPSGTMANQVALRTLTRPGDEVVVSRECHAGWHEAGGSAANAGVQLKEIGQRGVFSVQEFVAAIKPRTWQIFPPTTLVEIENTHNRAGGVVFPQAEVRRICELARATGIASFLDGARLWNAAVQCGLAPARLAAPFDLVMAAFSKGLGAPAGSMLAGPKDLIASAARHRRMLGGAMRQVGMFAAACDHALTHNLARLAEDHANARLIAERLAGCRGVTMRLERLMTNIVVFELEGGCLTAAQLVAAARESGVLINAFSPVKVRLVTHLDVSRADCLRAAEVIAAMLDG